MMWMTIHNEDMLFSAAEFTWKIHKMFNNTIKYKYKFAI